jgi:hypothetical protein
MYFNSQQQWEKAIDNDFRDAKLCCDRTLVALNEMSHQFRYTVPLNIMVNSFF